MAESELAALAGEKEKSVTEKAAAATNRRNAEADAARAEHIRKTRAGALDTDGHDGATADPDLHPDVSRADETNLEVEIQRIRQKRIGWGSGLQQKLALPKRRGYHRHWFNDSGNRIEDAKASGWAHIKGSDGKPIERAVGTARSGQPLKAFAMELPEAIWLEDLDAKNKLGEDQIEQVRTKPFQAPRGMAQKSDAGKFYSVNEGDGPVGMEIGSRK